MLDCVWIISCSIVILSSNNFSVIITKSINISRKSFHWLFMQLHKNLYILSNSHNLYSGMNHILFTETKLKKLYKFCSASFLTSNQIIDNTFIIRLAARTNIDIRFLIKKSSSNLLIEQLLINSAFS